MVDVSLISDVLNWCILALEAVGVILLIYGALAAVIRIIKAELSNKQSFLEYESRNVLIQKMVIAIDFFVAATLIKLILVSGINEVLFLAFTVGIRTLLNWSITMQSQTLKIGSK